MSKKFEIHPKIGVARLGNSPEQYYLSPEKVGGLPIQCDMKTGDALKNEDGSYKFVQNFKDEVGRVKRQAAKFKIFPKGTDEDAISLEDDDIERIEWFVHIANKKPIWYTFSELQGNLEFGENNSYVNQHVIKNNPKKKGKKRKKLMIDPGPRNIDTPGDHKTFSRYNIPSDYPNGSFPGVENGGEQIDILGELRMDSQGNLIALGGLGNVTGDAQIDSFRGAAGYWDDTSDGYILATITLKDGTKVEADPAWLLVGSPKYAPELVNISTLYDTQYDIAIRKMAMEPTIYNAEDKGTYNPYFPYDQGYSPLEGFQEDYIVNFESQVKPIIDRMAEYRWVTEIPLLNSFTNPQFDMSDNCEENKANRMQYSNCFRMPLLPEDYTKELMGTMTKGPNQLTSHHEDDTAIRGLPLMPLNSGDNSVTNSGPLYKFETLKATQYFFLYQWAQGKFEKGDASKVSNRLKLTQSTVGNCVGAPFSPGIETTWIVRNEKIYHKPFTIKVGHFSGSNEQLNEYYKQNGLSTTADEGEGFGVEPGDLTKRMAIPWQSDFQECTVQTPNTTVPTVNQFADGTGIEVPPAYYVYWWPPQSPMHVMTGSMNPQDQVLDALVSVKLQQSVVPAGQRVSYQRGILNPQDMIDSWSRLGFIVNAGTTQYPNFVESERDFQAFGQLATMQQSALVEKTLPK